MGLWNDWGTCPSLEFLFLLKYVENVWRIAGWIVDREGNRISNKGR